MQNLSYWGLMNPVKARLIIIMLQILFCLLTLNSGMWLFEQNILLPKLLFNSGLVLFLVAFALYPIKRARYRFWKHTLKKQIVMGSLLMISYVMVSMTWTNRAAHNTYRKSIHTAQIVPIALKSPLKSVDKTLTFKEKWQKRYVAYVVKRSPTKAQLTAGQITGILLTVVGMVLALLLVVGLACSATCPGGAGNGNTILIGGTVLVLALGIWIIRSIVGKRPDNYQPMPTQ